MKSLAGALAAAALLALAPLPAAADGTKIIIRGGTFQHHPRFFAGHPHARIIYVVPSYPRWVPGYWTYQWIPQSYSHYVWVPGYYDPNGYWVEGQYAPQTVWTGYYQPLWVNGYWAP